MGNDNFVTHDECEEYRKDIYKRMDVTDKNYNELDKTVSGHAIILRQVSFWGRLIVTAVIGSSIAQIISNLMR